MYQDKLEQCRESLLKSKVPLNMTQENAVQGFVIDGNEPTGSERKFLFKVDGKIYRLAGNVPQQLLIDENNIDEVLTQGNTAAELLTITSLAEWIGKDIYPIIGLRAPANSSVMPSVSLGLKCKSSADQYKAHEDGPSFYLGNKARFIGAVAEYEVENKGTAELKVRLLQDGVWTSWKDQIDLQGQFCQEVQVRGEYTVVSATGGSSTARIKNVEVYYSKFADEVAAEESAIYLTQQYYPENMTVGSLGVFHPILRDCELSAYICYEENPVPVKEVELGEGTGSQQTFEVEGGLEYGTFSVSINGIKTTNYTYTSSTNTVTLTAPAGSKITVSFYTNINPEVWEEMELQFTERDFNSTTDLYFTRFLHTLENVEGSKLVKAKIICKVKSGTETFNEIATGDWQEIPLAHPAQKHSIICNTTYKFDEDTNILRIKAPRGYEVEISYSWQGKPVNFEKFYAAFAV